MSFHDFIMSLDLDYNVITAMHKEKNDIGNFIHFFDIEIKDPTPDNKPIKWT